jgi:hypothetical protein
MDRISPEALLGVTGIGEILSDEPRKITAGDKSAAEMMPREVRRSASRFVDEADELRPVPKAKAFDYGKMLKQLTEAVVMDQANQPTVKPQLLEDIAACFKPEDHDLASGYMANVQRVLLYLQPLLPLYVETTMAKAYNYDPSDTEIARFRRAYDVANDPMVICRDMELGILMADQMTHLEACCPRFTMFLKAQLGAAMADALARKKSWKLPWRKERVVQVVYGTDTFSPALAKDLQATFANAQQTSPGPPPSRAASKIATMVQPQTQATADGDLRK